MGADMQGRQPGKKGPDPADPALAGRKIHGCSSFRKDILTVYPLTTCKILFPRDFDCYEKDPQGGGTTPLYGRLLGIFSQQ